MWISNRIVNGIHFSYTSFASWTSSIQGGNVWLTFKGWLWYRKFIITSEDQFSPVRLYCNSGKHTKMLHFCHVLSIINISTRKSEKIFWKKRMSKHVIDFMNWRFSVMLCLLLSFLCQYCVWCRYKYQGEKFYQSSYPWNWTGSKLSAFLPTHLLSFLSYKA